MDSYGPIFFRQKRVGLNEAPFLIHKFRTMYVDAEASGLKITVGADPRITKVGAIIRKYKIDELPQLIDVFIGSMSLVGLAQKSQFMWRNIHKSCAEKFLVCDLVLLIGPLLNIKTRMIF